MNTLTNLKAFLKEPRKALEYNPIEIRGFAILLLLTLTLIVPYGFLLELAGIDQFDHRLEELMKNNKWLIAVFAVVFAPLIEEPIFRLHLDLKKSHIWWSLGLSVLLISEIWYPAVLLMLYLIFLQIRVSQNNPASQKIVVYVSAALFALIHMVNFKEFDYSQYFYWVPFLVGIQFWMGLVLSYIRLNHGMKWAVAFHAVYNAVLVIPAVYFYEA